MTDMKKTCPKRKHKGQLQHKLQNDDSDDDDDDQ